MNINKFPAKQRRNYFVHNPEGLQEYYINLVDYFLEYSGIHAHKLVRNTFLTNYNIDVTQFEWGRECLDGSENS